MNSGAVSEAVAKAEAELVAFWATANEAEEPKARASTMNFVALGAPSEVERLRAQVEELAHTRAGRVFLITLDGRLAPWTLEPEVNAVCHKEGETVICYDRIELAFGAMAAARAPSVLKALCLPEVPTIIEAGPGAPGVLVDPLIAVCDRLIVDSAQLGVGRVAEIAGKGSAPIADRAFLRMFSFRELTACFFDDCVPAARAIRRVEIERTGAAEGTALGKRDPAALFFGWLASRLGWRFEASARAVDQGGAPIELVTALVPAWGDLGPGEITRVSIVTSSRGAPLALSCAREARDPRTARWTREGALTSSHDHALGFHDESWVLRKAIDATEGDGIYRQAVELAADWSGR